MNYPRYPEYKPSGVEWLGEVPAHWGVQFLKRGFDVCLGKMLQTSAASEHDVEAPYLRAANIQRNGVDVSDVKTMWFSPAECEQLALLPNDLLVSEGGDVGRAAIWQGELLGCYFQNSINRVRAKGENSTRFLYYWLSLIKEGGYIDVVCNKSTIAHFTAEKVAAVPIVLPSSSEQRAITAFLDHETARIDALIARKQRLIELLAEKCAALINQAVTKGLNPDAPMKDSRVAWLGEIPMHWEIKRLKFLTKGGLVNGIFKKKDEYGSGTLLVNVFDVYRDDFLIDPSSLERVETSKQEAESYEVLSGDMFFVRSSLKLEGVGKSACALDIPEPMVFECHVVRARPDEQRIVPRFLNFYLNSKLASSRLVSLANMVTMATLDQGKIKGLEITRPPLEEQLQIVGFIDQQIVITESTVEKIRGAITSLQEYRTSLISAAVTGKIDVRSLLKEREVA